MFGLEEGPEREGERDGVNPQRKQDRRGGIGRGRRGVPLPQARREGWCGWRCVCVATARLGVREITPDTTVSSWEQSATV